MQARLKKNIELWVMDLEGDADYIKVLLPVKSVVPVEQVTEQIASEFEYCFKGYEGKYYIDIDALLDKRFTVDDVDQLILNNEDFEVIDIFNEAKITIDKLSQKLDKDIESLDSSNAKLLKNLEKINEDQDKLHEELLERQARRNKQLCSVQPCGYDANKLDCIDCKGYKVCSHTKE